MIVGEGEAAWKPVFKAHAAHPIVDVSAPVVSAGRYGRYLKLIAGSTIGKLRIVPVKTADVSVADIDARIYTDEQAIEAIEIDAARHNSEVQAASRTTGASRPRPGRSLSLISACRGTPPLT